MVVSERSRKASPLDELQATEERCLSQLVMAIHHDRRIGIAWPKMKRISMRWDGGKLEESDAETATEWHIRAWCMTVPK